MIKMEPNPALDNPVNDPRILLLLLPFWTPLMPPMGITSIKSFLTRHGYRVKTVDGNIEPELWDIHHRYFNLLKSYIPEHKRGNFYNIGYNVLRNHLMAHLNSKNTAESLEIMRTVIAYHYYCDTEIEQVAKLNEILALFYTRLENYLSNLFQQEKPEIVGISVFSGTLPASLFAFQWIKKNFPFIRTLMGGGIFVDQLIVGSPDLELFLEKTPYIDTIMIGEGEILWLKYLQGKLPKQQKVYTLKDIQGETLDLNTRDIPDHSDLHTQYYPYLGATGTVGCPYRCGFCNAPYYWGEFRKKDISKTVQEMIMLYRQYGSQLFFMTDSLLNPIISELAAEFVKSDVALYWDGYLRVGAEVCNLENTLLWRRGGFYRARLGVESGSQRLLDSMQKKITLEQIKASISALAEAGIKTTTYCVIGYPGETEQDFQQTLDLIEEMKDDIWESECNPFYFFYNGQTNSGEWANRRKPLYSEKEQDVLISQTWLLDTEPSRKEIYERVFRFCEHCNKLGIPNPYSLQEIHAADERWARLHKNAVPPLIHFKNKDRYIDECKKINKLLVAQNIFNDSQNFQFY